MPMEGEGPLSQMSEIGKEENLTGRGGTELHAVGIRPTVGSRVRKFRYAVHKGPTLSHFGS